VDDGRRGGGMSKLSGLMNANESMICSRLRTFREEHGWTRVDLAEVSGETMHRIASFEHARNPLRFLVGEKLCAALGINRAWLIEGKLPQVGYVPLSPEMSRKIPSRLLYSQAYEQFLKQKRSIRTQRTNS
jgi:transcriptional regulator with XRE-family HTH domain